MATMPWFRYYSEVARDRKIVMAAKIAGVSKAEMIGAWSIILCLANDSPIRGKLLVTLCERFTETDIEAELGTDAETTAKILLALKKYEMLAQNSEGCYYIKNWEKRQFDSDNSTPRVKKYREKQKEQPETPDETLQKRFGNPPEAEAEADTETDTEAERAPGWLDPFDAMQKLIETKTGYPATQGDIQIINDFITRNITEIDIDMAMDFLKDKKTIHGAKDLEKSVYVAYAKRVQNGNGNSHKRKVTNANGDEIWI